jgi:hypothetical protein
LVVVRAAGITAEQRQTLLTDMRPRDCRAPSFVGLPQQIVLARHGGGAEMATLTIPFAVFKAEAASAG